MPKRFPTLSLTSPHTKGHDVEVAQNLLIRAGYLKGPADGEFGSLTGAAAYRAKYNLGYPKPDQRFGAELYGYLSGNAKPNALYRGIAAVRRRKAAAAAKKVPKGVRFLNLAISQLGETESPPNSNRSKYTAWYGMVGPWCAMFITWCGVQLGIKGFVRGSHYAYVPALEADARLGRNGFYIVHDALPGDLVLYDWDHDGVADHIGTFEKWLDTSHNPFSAIEGNTAFGNNSNGGKVQRREDRVRSEVRCFVRYR